MNKWTRRIVRGALLLAAIALLVYGVRLTRKVYEDDEVAAEFGIYTFEHVPERNLVIDATFSGCVKKDGKLFTTYDRSEPLRGKRACPT